MDELIKLISVSYVTDELKQRVPVETIREVWAHISSVSRAEWFEGGQNGLKPSLVADTPIVNYNDEKTVVIRGKRYTVYRTYFSYNSDLVELYLEEQVQDVNH